MVVVFFSIRTFGTGQGETKMAVQSRWEACVVEWLWNQDSIRINMPDGTESTSAGSYAEIAKTLSQLGGEGWEVSTCAANGNWLFWTLKRQIA
jgi:hypothetical protein